MSRQALKPDLPLWVKPSELVTKRRFPVTRITGVKSQSFAARSRIADEERLLKQRNPGGRAALDRRHVQLPEQVRGVLAEFRAASVHAVTSLDDPATALSSPRNCRLGRIFDYN
jgi:hypothetical protein